MSQFVNGEEVTVVLSAEAFQILQDIALKSGLSLEDALARALSHEQLIATQQREGGRVLIEKNRILRELVTS